ncbi:YibE/F family protein [Clostridium oryzae]|uniref:YibE/F-like protein n=1 Tax=Clostridium oryzae TaxID=1450648 RepID=A0A1V4IXH7_9CLOT|nr:YibE/F family protein [Clostridium oryzae]OPJ64656.1 YibE/F-like protein [Clostridium oryzae]
MTIEVLLLLILFILMAVVGGRRGIKSFFTLCLNFLTLSIILIIIGLKADPIKVTIVGCVIITSITLFYINGFNRKTVSALFSVTIVVLVATLLTYRIGTLSYIQGFANEEIEDIMSLSFYVQLDFQKIVICQMLMGLLGAIIDVSISISSFMNELYIANKTITWKSMFNSGMNIGKDILGTMSNTLLFAYIGGFMTLIIYFNELNYSFTDIINGKIFCAEIFQVLCGGIGVVLIIPVTALVAAKIIPMQFGKGKIDEEPAKIDGQN